MLTLALSMVRFRKAAFIGAYVALFLATALIGACGILLETGLQGSIPAGIYAGTPIVVAGNQSVQTARHEGDKAKTKTRPLDEHAWIPASVAGLLSAVPGVRETIQELTFPAYVVIDGRGVPVPGPDETPSWGHPWSSAPLTPFTLLAGRAPVTSDQVVIDAALASRAGLHLDSVVTVQATAAPASYLVVGIAAPARNSADPGRQPALFFSPGQARLLAGHPGQVTAIGVLPDRGVAAGALAARISRALSGTPAKIYTGDERGPLEFPAAANARVLLISLGGVLGGTALLVAILVVANAFGLSAQQRGRELALLRAVAVTPRQMRAMIGREALLVGLLAGPAGCAVSVPIAVLLRNGLIKAGVIPGTLHLAITPVPMLAAVVATLTAGWIAARLAARRSISIRPARALTEAEAEPPALAATRLLAGLAFLAGSLVLTAVLTALPTLPAAMPVTVVTALTWVTALALLGPVLSRAAAAAMPQRGLSRVGGYLAAASMRTSARRVAGIITPLSLAITMSCTILFAQTTLGHAAQLQAQDGIAADYELSAPDGPGIASAAAEAARRLPGVTGVTEMVHTSVRGLSLAQYTAQGVTPAGLGKTLNLGVRAGSLDDLDAGTVALSTTAASGLSARIGGRIRLWLGDGTLVSLRVIAIYARGLGFADITLARDLVAAHIDDPLDDTVLIKTMPGATRVAAALSAIARAYPGGRVLDRSGIRAQDATQQKASADVQYLEMALIIAFIAIAVVNALAMATAGRSREFALLRLIGTSRRQVLRMMRWESLVVTLVAAILGTLISTVTLAAFSLGITGSYTPYIPPLTYLAVIAGAAAVTFTATEMAVRGALRGHPAAKLD